MATPTCCVLACLALSAPAPTKEELAAAIREARAALGPWHATVIATQLTSNAEYPATETFAFQVGFGKLRYDESWLRMGEDAGQIVRSRFMYDGARTARASRVGNSGSIRDGVDPEYTLAQCMYLRAMFYLPIEVPDPDVVNDLSWRLEATLSTVRPALEAVEGHECVVVDLWSGDGSMIASTVWLDPARGYLPRLRRMPGVDPAQPSLEVLVKDFLELGPGRYLPKEVFYSTHDPSGEHVVSMQMVPGLCGDGVSPEFASASSSSIFWPGMTVQDLDTGEVFVASAARPWTPGMALAGASLVAGLGCFAATLLPAGSLARRRRRYA